MIRNCRDGCSLLIGAGCSVSAGIPTAAGFVELIGEQFPIHHRQVDPKTYAKCMAALPPGMRRGLIEDKVDNARINWAHLAIAQLMKAEFVDRVLTTNFDPLVVRACALVGETPAVYDFAASQLLKPEHIPPKAVFHLHGQRTGFVLLITDDEVGKHSERLAPLFKTAGQGKAWIVVGYSGENDPVLTHLAEVWEFEFGLYWVGYKDADPSPHVRERLLQPGKSASYVRGFDADGFFMELARRLKVFPPEFVHRPFSHLTELLKPVVEFKLKEGGQDVDVLAKPRRLIADAAERYEASELKLEGRQGDDAVDLEAMSKLMAGRLSEVQELYSGAAESVSQTARDAVAWSYIERGRRPRRAGAAGRGEEAQRLWRLAGEKYAEALRIKPDMPTRSTTGACLRQASAAGRGRGGAAAVARGRRKICRSAPDQAGQTRCSTIGAWPSIDRREQAEARKRSGCGVMAGEKYAEALRVKPDRHETLTNWGVVLSLQAQRAKGEEAQRLWRMADEKYAEALRIKPDGHKALHNWGTALDNQAQRAEGEEAQRLWRRPARNMPRRSGSSRTITGAQQLGRDVSRACHRPPDRTGTSYCCGGAKLRWPTRWPQPIPPTIWRASRPSGVPMRKRTPVKEALEFRDLA